jgi:hypothetical protein
MIFFILIFISSLYYPNSHAIPFGKVEEAQKNTLSEKWKTRGHACDDAVRKLTIPPLTDDSAPLS